MTVEATKMHFEVYSEGTCYASVCTTITDPREVERKIRYEHPAGTEANWSWTGEKFRTGQDNPSPCHDTADRFHYLLSC